MPARPTVNLLALDQTHGGARSPREACSLLWLPSRIVNVSPPIGVTSTARTAEQSEIAKFWLENTAASWARISGQVSADRKMNGWDRMRLFAADRGRRGRRLHRLGRLQALLQVLAANHCDPRRRQRRQSGHRRRSDLDAVRSGDAAGTRLRVGPRRRGWSRGRGAAGRAGRRRQLQLYQYLATGTTRSFTSFSQVANEIGLARIYVGYHFRLAVTE